MSSLIFLPHYAKKNLNRRRASRGENDMLKGKMNFSVEMKQRVRGLKGGGEVSRSEETEGEEARRQLLLCKGLLQTATF